MVFVFICCIACKKNKFSISPQSHDGSTLHLNGYYFTKSARANSDSLIDILFFYANGVVLYATSNDSQLSADEADFKSGAYYQMIKNTRNYWGPYKIDGSSLYFERWNPQEFYPIHAFIANIINKEQFELVETYNIVRKKQKLKSALNDIYRFKSFALKPDSSNAFVK
ncbi:MAG: hypothetical protein WCR21_06160 [Bacteroidota bacterium]